MSNMVVATNVLANNSHRNLKMVGTRQSQSSARLSSGYRVNSAADDAAGLAISEKMRAQIKGLDMASKNTQDGISLIQTAEGGMQEINNMLLRIRELVVQVSNDTNEHNTESTGDRQKIQDEISQLTQEIDTMADRVEFNKKKVINGSFADVSKQLEDAKAALGAAKTGAPAASTQTEYTVAQRASILDDYRQISSNAGKLQQSYQSLSNSAAKLKASSQSKLDKCVAGMQEKITQKENTLTNKQTDITNKSIAVTIKEASAFSKDIDAAKKLGSAQRKESLAASKLSAGNANLAEASALRLQACGLTGADQTKALNNAKKLASAGQKLLTSAQTLTTSAGALKTSSQSLSTSASNIRQNSVTALQGSVTALQSSARALGASVDTLTTSLSVKQTCALTQRESAKAYEISAGKKKIEADAEFELANKYKAMLDGNSAGTGSTGTGTALRIEAMSAKVKALESKSAEASSSLYFQVGANADQGIQVNIGSVTTDILGIGDGEGNSSIDVLKFTGKDTTGYLDVMDDALSYVSTERSKMGAIQNRLDYAMKSLDISSENLTAAESRIRDTDMAKEMMKLTQANVLQQAATSMLAQANQAPQSVLQLLG